MYMSIIAKKAPTKLAPKYSLNRACRAPCVYKCIEDLLDVLSVCIQGFAYPPIRARAGNVSIKHGAQPPGAIVAHLWPELPCYARDADVHEEAVCCVERATQPRIAEVVCGIRAWTRVRFILVDHRDRFFTVTVVQVNNETLLYSDVSKTPNAKQNGTPKVNRMSACEGVRSDRQGDRQGGKRKLYKQINR